MEGRDEAHGGEVKWSDVTRARYPEQDIDRAREIIAALETQPAYTGN